MYQLVKYLALDPELHRKRKRAISFSLLVTAAVVLLVFQVRFPVHVDFAGIVQPDDPVNADGIVQSGTLKSAGSGRVVAVVAHDGQLVNAGDTIVQLDDPEVRRDLVVYNAKVQEIEAKMRQARVEDQIDFIKDSEDLKVVQDELKDAERQESELTIASPFTGRLVAPNLHELAGTFVQRGQEIGRVAVLDRLVIKGDIEQTDFELIHRIETVKVEVRLAGRLGQAIPGGKLKLPPAGVMELADPSLGARGGEGIQVDTRDPNGLRTLIPTFEAWVKLDNAGGQYYPGQRAFVRLTVDRRTPAWQWTNKFLQLFHAHDPNRW